MPKHKIEKSQLLNDYVILISFYSKYGPISLAVTKRDSLTNLYEDVLRLIIKSKFMLLSVGTSVPEK